MIERMETAAMSKPLTKRQIIAICQLASKAYKVMSPALGDMTQDEFRHDAIYNITGHTSLKNCVQIHYIPIYNHFATCAGLPLKQDSTWSDTDKAIHILNDAMSRHELTPFYLSAIAGSKFPILRCRSADSILDAIRRHLTAQQVMQLVYTINSRGRSITSKLTAQHDLDPEAIREPHADPSTLPPGGLSDYFNADPSN